MNEVIEQVFLFPFPYCSNDDKHYEVRTNKRHFICTYEQLSDLLYDQKQQECEEAYNRLDDIHTPAI